MIYCHKGVSTMFRLAEERDIKEIAKIYENILNDEKSAPFTGWIKGIYPTEKVAADAYSNGELYVYEENGQILASAKINKEQMPGYEKADWHCDVPDDEVMVLHTLVVRPSASGKGIGRKFVKFYEDFALENGCKYLRMDTNEINLPARTLYKKLGYDEVGIVRGDFCGIPNIGLVCLEKEL